MGGGRLARGELSGPGDFYEGGSRPDTQESGTPRHPPGKFQFRPWPQKGGPLAHGPGVWGPLIPGGGDSKKTPPGKGGFLDF
jgi:hypothetical protein